MSNKIIICYDREGKISAILPEELKPDCTTITCITIDEQIINDDIVNGE
ncbi:MAG: hypothetical protein KatS3mg003_0778 [Candidatus Nitrosocaldaceae archaeon]|nr:MAG: hypothetical protein KatS3mg003_0778 [Candidatus Nitrosocaldaceae archaeon]